MIHFETDSFQKQKFTYKQVIQLLSNAKKDLHIAQKDNFSEVRFMYSYNSLIKAGIALIAIIGQVKVKSNQGHHYKIIEKMTQILHDDELLRIGNAMRSKRNLDFYGGGAIISEKESSDYYRFVEKIIKKVEEVIKNHSAM